MLRSFTERWWCHMGSFGSNFGVNEKCHVIILGDKVKVAVMRSNDGVNEETLLVNDVPQWY